MRVLILAGTLVLGGGASALQAQTLSQDAGASPAPMILAQTTKKSAKRPPAADMVWDVRSSCLYGEVETKKVSDKDRLKACDQLAKFENDAQEVGHCWNQNFAEYKRCE